MLVKVVKNASGRYGKRERVTECDDYDKTEVYDSPADIPGDSDDRPPGIYLELLKLGKTVKTVHLPSDGDVAYVVNSENNKTVSIYHAPGHSKEAQV